MPTRTCSWCQSKHAGQFYKLDDNQYYCVPCAASRLYKSGKISESILNLDHDRMVERIETVLFLDVSDIEVDKATKELQQWIEEAGG